MKQFLDIDYNHALWVVVTAAGAATAKAASYAPAPPTWWDVLAGFGGGVLGAVIMVAAMPGLRAETSEGRRFVGPLFLILITAAWSGLASSFTAVMILERIGLMMMGGSIATALGGFFSAIVALVVFPLLIRIVGWVSRNLERILEAAFAYLKRIGGAP